MKKTVILTEKPSVARQFADVLGCEQKKGYYESNNYIVTYSFGHLFELDEVKCGVPKQWSMDTLPITIKTPMYKIKHVNNKPDAGALSQFKIISDLLKNTDTVINCGDAGREGELIQRIIIQMSGYRGKVLRFWTSEALTKDVILKGLKNLKPASEYDSLYYSALARQVSDAIVGFNFTRAATLSAGSKSVVSVGRVQTPTLYFLYERKKAIDGHVKQEYYVVSAVFEHPKERGNRYVGVLMNPTIKDADTAKDGGKEEETADEKEESKDTIRLNKSQAEALVNSLKGKHGVVFSVTVQDKEEPPPLLHSLTSLQRECNVLLGLSAQSTLDILQSLYEPPLCLVSYPRTDSNYLGENNVDMVREILTKLGYNPELATKPGKRMYDNSKLTDHHAIVPFDKLKDGLTAEQIKVYNLVYRRFVGMFMPNYTYQDKTVITLIDKYCFKSKGKTVKNLGWMQLYQERHSEDLLLPNALKPNEVVDVIDIKGDRRETKPPPLYTEATLLKAMERNKLGTPATRAGIIETLKRHGYILLRNKKIEITEKGVGLIEYLVKEGIDIYKPDLTGQWEDALEQIYTKKAGIHGYYQFVDGINNYVRKGIDIVKSKKIHINLNYTANSGNKKTINKTKGGFRK